ncbi:MAG: hypothetical protein ABJD97_19170 [Betaproteobacteria bacterium]
MKLAILPGAAAAPAGVLLRLHSLLTRPIRLERRGYDWHFVFEPPVRPVAARRAADPSPRLREPVPTQPRDTMPDMTNQQVAELCTHLRAALGGDIGRHPRMPSLALLERALYKDGVRGIDEVPAAVLRHAAQCLDTLDLDQYGPGLVVLRRRIGQVLRRRHGDGRARAAIPQPVLRPAMRAVPPDDVRDFSDSLTEFIDLDRMFADSRH